jgi:hypothetical protein
MGMLERLLAVSDTADPAEFAHLAGALRTAGSVWSNGPALALVNGDGRFERSLIPEDADSAEEFLWNRLFALQTADGDGFRADLPDSGWRPQGYYAGPLESDARTALALARIPGLFYVTAVDGVRIDQYGPSAARFEVAGVPVRIRQRTSYPSDGAVLVEVEPARPVEFTVRFRMPKWCPVPTVRLNGRSVGEGGIRRLWKPGDRMDLQFPMEQRWERGRGGVRLVRGPLQYFAEAEPGLRAGPVELYPASGPDSLGPQYRLTRSGVRITPLANLGEWYRTEAEKSWWLESIASHPAWAADPLRGKSHPFSAWLRRDSSAR